SARPGRLLARSPPGRSRVVHRRQRLVEVRPQRVHRALAVGRRGALARRALRPARAPGAAGARARGRAVHGPHRVPRDRQARGAAAAGEALNPEVLRAWEQATGLQIRDGYGQTETGQLTGIPHDVPARPGSMGRALPGMRLSVVDGELTVDPASVPTFFLGYLGEQVHRDASGAWSAEDRRAGGPWRTGDRVSEDGEGWLYFEGREDDVIVSAGYPLGPFEVESALVAHPAVAEAAAVAAPDEERGAVVRAVVVLREGLATASPELVRELQEHVKSQTAPYKYPRIVDFAEELPKTASGKIKRAELRAG